MKRPVRIVFRTLSVLLALVLLAGIAVVIILPSEWFREKVRRRIVHETERASGGKVEIGAFRFDWRALRAEVAPFVLRGTEPASHRPLFRAELLQVDLKLVSILKKDIDVEAVLVDRPQINLLIDEKGISNLPRPNIRRDSSRTPIEPLLKLQVGTIRLRDGELWLAERRIKLELYGERLNSQLAYNVAGPSYLGELSLERLDVNAPPVLPISAGLHGRVELFQNHLKILGMRATTQTAQVEGSGTLEDFRDMRLALSLNANGSLTELGPRLRLPEPHTGNVQFRGTLNYDSRERLRVAGRMTGQGLAVRQAGVNIDGIAIATDVRYGPGMVALSRLRVDALDGRFDGSAEIRELESYRINGRVSELSINALSGVAGIKKPTFAGIVSGPVEIRGSFAVKHRDLMAAGKLEVRAGAQGVPIQGNVEAAYDRRKGTLQLGQSHLSLPSSRVDFSGALGGQLRVRADSRNLDDFLPLVSALGPATEMPVKLRDGGTALFDGTVTGALTNPQITGRVDAGKFRVRDQEFDRLVAEIDANKDRLQAKTFGLGQQQLALEGSSEIGLSNWKLVDASAVKAAVRLDGAQVAKLLALSNRKLPISGVLSGKASVTGTAGSPNIAAQIEVLKPELYGESFDRMSAEVRYAGEGVEVINGVAEAGPARVLISGVYEHPPNDWKTGAIRIDVSTRDYRLENIANLRRLEPNLLGRGDIKATGTLLVRNGTLLPQTVNGTISVRNASYGGREIGDATINARTDGDRLTYDISGVVRASKITGSGTVQLSGDYPVTGKLDFSPLSLIALQRLVQGGTTPPTMRGTIQGSATFSGLARKPDTITASLTIPSFEMIPTRRAVTEAGVGVAPRQLTLRNMDPIIFDYKKGSVVVRQAHLVGRETDINVAGMIGLQAKANYDMRVNGHLNLEVLQDFNPDVISSGVAQVAATVKGPLENPNVQGRMELKNASFSIADLPNGIENATGTIVFDQQRATIQRVTAQTGGGDLILTGFVGFTGGNILYQLQARGEKIRIRYPEGVSTTATAVLTLTGSPQQSLLSGVVTVLRAGFNPRTDVGGLLAASAVPASTPVVANPFLRGMQFDVRIETIPNLQFQTSLTQDLQAEADLRLRGTAAKPAVLGRIVVNQGQIQFFGNRYTINRGEIGFFNPVKFEPVLDMDLETRVRGVLVNITFSGSLGKLNVSYRSDPPLQSAEIVALLAVGRAPGSSTSLASSQTVTSQSFLASGGNSLLGQAVAAPVSSRLQRFFGVSRLKIDPQLTGVNAVPQARLTIEQQISKDVTLTYITNLSEANQQIIRLEWSLSRSWSVVALREENGVFGIDFFFKKRLR